MVLPLFSLRRRGRATEAQSSRLRVRISPAGPLRLRGFAPRLLNNSRFRLFSSGCRVIVWRSYAPTENRIAPCGCYRRNVAGRGLLRDIDRSGAGASRVNRDRVRRGRASSWAMGLRRLKMPHSSSTLVALGRSDGAAKCRCPQARLRVDLAGKTVMPAIVDTHTHMPTTREQLVDRLQRKAYYGVGAVASLGQDTGDVAFQVREEVVPERRAVSHRRSRNHDARAGAHRGALLGERTKPKPGKPCRNWPRGKSTS